MLDPQTAARDITTASDMPSAMDRMIAWSAVLVFLTALGISVFVGAPERAGAAGATLFRAPLDPADPGARAAGGVPPGQQLTGIGASILSRPRPVLATDGRYHLAYELVLTGAVRSAIDVRRVEVRDARTKRVLHSLAGSALSSSMNPVAGPTGDAAANTRIAPSGTSVVWMDARVRRRADLPRALEHRVVATTQSTPGGQVLSFTSLVGRVSVSSAKPLELGPPVGSGRWVSDEGCCNEDTHHRRGLLFVDGDPVVPQRFAIDWMKIDSRNRVWAGDPRRLSSYVSYGEPLIAAADGTVVVSHDGEPNARPPDNPPAPPLSRLPGNHVTLRVAPGVYVLYAHMVPGSVRVRVGQRVRRGQMLGRLGNSGNSATPHMHLQVQINRSFVSDGLPFVFDRFQFLGQITTRFSDATVGLRPNGQLRFAPASNAGTRHRQMPLDRNVVRFPVTSLTGRTR